LAKEKIGKEIAIFLKQAGSQESKLLQAVRGTMLKLTGEEQGGLGA
jgi:hypothetical protein